MDTGTDEQLTPTTFSQREEVILAFWRDHQIFQKSLAARADSEHYTFYDGPPFATGTPHYGHILASAIKDAVPRYQTMRGRYVARRWGWDCHGLPIENIVEKSLGISGKKEIEAYGVDKFNAEARSKVLAYVHDWKKTVERMARWVDFDGSYKTMDTTYIESVWWALGELTDKGLIYEGTRVLPYCTRCETPIAQSEIAMDNSYKLIRDLSVYVKFELVDEPGTYLLAWTTTPWTLPGNTAAAVRGDLTYIKVLYRGERYIVAKPLAEKLFVEEYQVLEEFPGSALIGKKYQPLFPYYLDREFPNKAQAWQVYAADYVADDMGSGIVHIAPAFGEEDMALAKQYQIPHITHVGRDGKFLPEVTDFAGLTVKPKDAHDQTDIELIKKLAADGTLFAKEKIEHAYPHCFRCETPLIYYALPAWFVKIEELKPRLRELNEQIDWVPGYLKHGRFQKSFEAAPDWNISRNRYWASPLPFWKCTECSALRVVRSAEEFRDQVVKRNTFVFLRHGEAEKDLSKILDYDDLGSGLTERGREQIRAVAETLKGQGITKIIASPVLRTTETATIVAEALGLPVESDPRIREIHFGELRGKPVAEWHALMQTPDDLWLTGVPGGETWTQVQQRMVDALEEINCRYRGEKILIVSHGDPLYTLFLRLAGKTERVMRDSDVAYPKEASVTTWDVNLFDLHRPYIDEITFTCDCGGQMTRIPEVIDCWFESASMPFAANHYPFENSQWFSKNFPADFVAEYIAQTRTWFYYMHVLSTILFDTAPFRHVVTTGTILAEDGQKMSKSKQNFPDPWLVFEKYGVDALRFHLLGSSLLKAEDMNFSESELADVFKKHILRLQNVLAFAELYPAAEITGDPQSTNSLDRWITARLAAVVQAVTEAMDRYTLDAALRPIGEFIDDLSVWYVRRSRERLKDEDPAISEPARATLGYVLTEFAKVIAPFIPFSAEMIYQSIRTTASRESVHLEDWPEVRTPDHTLLEQMARIRALVELGHADRNTKGIKLRQPLSQVTLTGVKELPGELVEILLEELNVKAVAYGAGEELTASVDPELTPELEREGLARELTRQIQSFRKEANLAIDQPAVIRWRTESSALKSVLTDAEFAARLKTTTLVAVDDTVELSKSVAVNGQPLAADLVIE